MGIIRHDIQLRDDEQVSDVPVTFPKDPLGNMPPKASQSGDLDPEQQRLLVCLLLSIRLVYLFSCGRGSVGYDRDLGQPET
jgi:hypothetical protein